MIKVYHVITGALEVNSYFLTNDGVNAILIDCGDDYNLIKNTEMELGLKVKAILLTHAHFDHSGCAKRLQDDGASIYISKLDAPKLKSTDNLAFHFGMKFEELTADYTFFDGDVLNVLGIEIKVIATPGHTDGSVCFIIDNKLYSGDTLFKLSFGRTDFPTGSIKDLVSSIKKLFNDYGGYAVYTGHGDFTSIDYEKKYNPIYEYDRY